MIIPALAAGAAAELDGLRAACDEAVRRLLAAGPAGLWIIGSGTATSAYSYPFRASFAPWGVPVEARLGEPPDIPGTDGPVLPLSLAVGVWLIRRALDAGAVSRATTWFAGTIAADATPVECAALGQRIARSRSRLALLVMGDGSACRGEKSPGYADPRAEPFDAAVGKALANADVEALLALDPALATELLAAGRAPWQVLAGAAAGGQWRGDVLYDAAPYGVSYPVASWEQWEPGERPAQWEHQP
jgi:hypothetical protein